LHGSYPFDNGTVVTTIATMWLSKEVEMPVTREVDVEATREEVWEALATEEGRERWLQEPELEIRVELVDEPRRLVWWWGPEDHPPTRVEFLLVAMPRGTRVVVTESLPSFPIAMLASSFAGVLA
jgi:uncharacterized protein YndB with AHSA1/START domain